MSDKTSQKTRVPGCVLRADGLAVRHLGEEVLLVPIRTAASQKNGIYTLNGTAVRMWELMDGTRTAEDIAREICVAFEADVKSVQGDVETLIADLLSIGAVVSASEDR